MDDPFFGAWQLWRVLKLVALVVLAGGVGLAIAAPTRRLRLMATYGYVVPALSAAYAAGWVLMKLSGRSPLEPWILAGIITSAGTVHAIFVASHRDRLRPVTPLLGPALLGAAMIVMVLRPGDPLGIVFALLCGSLAGGLVALPARRLAPSVTEDDAVLAFRGFVGVAWAEGGSLLFLLLVLMPLKYGFGIYIDGGTGVVGWVHGVLVLVYFQALASTGRMLGWSARIRTAAFVAAFLPAGPFVFERWVRKHARVA